jgi:hypothetical protein
VNDGGLIISIGNLNKKEDNVMEGKIPENLVFTTEKPNEFPPFPPGDSLLEYTEVSTQTRKWIYHGVSVKHKAKGKNGKVRSIPLVQYTKEV